MERTIKVGVLITEKDKVLLIKEWSDSKHGYYWNIVKGTYDDGIDKSLLDCVVREAKEEAGVTVSIKNFISIVIKHGYDIRIYVNFVGSISYGKPHIAPTNEQLNRNEQIKELKWFSVADLKSMENNEFITDIAFNTIKRWINKEIYPLNILKEIDSKPNIL